MRERALVLVVIVALVTLASGCASCVKKKVRNGCLIVSEASSYHVSKR